MNTILVIIGVIAILGAVYYIAWKKGYINDRDKDLVPDEVEDAVEGVKKVAKEVKRRGKNVKKEIKDVVEAAKEVGNQLGDVSAAIKGKKRQGRKTSKK